MKVLFIFFLLLLCFAAKAQLPVDSAKIDVDARYAKAVKYFNDGQIKAVIDVLDPVLWRRMKMARVSKEARAEMFKLAAQSYIILNNTELAVECAKQMLAYNPNYKIRPNESDLAMLKNATDTLYPIPRLMVGIKYGSVYTMPQLITPYSMLYELNPAVIKQEYYKNTFSFIASGIVAEYAIAKRLSLVGEAMFSRNYYDYAEDLQLTGADENLYTYTQSLDYIEIPAQLKFQFFYKTKLRPYVSAGVFYKMLVAAKKTGNYQGRDLKSSNSIQLSASDFGSCIAAGASYYLEKSCIKFDVRYNKGMVGLKNKSKRYLNDGQSDVFLYGAYDELDQLQLNSLQFSISYLFYLSHKVF